MIFKILLLSLFNNYFCYIVEIIMILYLNNLIQFLFAKNFKSLIFNNLIKLFKINLNKSGESLNSLFLVENFLLYI